MQTQGALYHGAFTPITTQKIEGYVWERVALSGNLLCRSLVRGARSGCSFLAFGALTPALTAARCRSLRSLLIVMHMIRDQKYESGVTLG